jgi:hypothetical protein
MAHKKVPFTMRRWNIVGHHKSDEGSHYLTVQRDAHVKVVSVTEHGYSLAQSGETKTIDLEYTEVEITSLELQASRLAQALALNNQLQARIKELEPQSSEPLEKRAETAYTVHAHGTFGVMPMAMSKDGRMPADAGKSGKFWQTAPMPWAQLPEFFKDKWRKIVKAIT